MRILFWGTPDFALPALGALTGEGHEVVGVVTQPDRPAGRGRTLRPPPVRVAAEAQGIPVFQPERARGDEVLSLIRELEPELSIVVAYGQILPQEILDAPELGSWNIHASLLPELRGAAPVQWAVIRGYETTGVSIMRMEAGLDSGPVLHTVEEPVRPDEVASDLATRLSEIGAEALIEALALLELGGGEAVPQDHSRATYAPKIDRATAHVDWSLPAVEVSRWIRGLDAVPGAWSELDGRPLKLFAPRVEVRSGAPGTVIEADADVGLLVAAGEDAVRIREVQPAGKRRMGAGEWIAGRGAAPGDRLR